MARRLPWKQKQGTKPGAKPAPDSPVASPGSRVSPPPEPRRRRLDESLGEPPCCPVGEAERQRDPRGEQGLTPSRPSQPLDVAAARAAG